MMASPPCESGEPSDLSTASSSATGNTTLDQEDTYENTATINHAAIVDIDIGAPTPRDSLTTRTPSIDDLIRLGPSAIMKCARQGGTSLRWVHLRTNCMHFVEDLMAKVVEERGLPMPEPCQSPPAKTNPILRKDLWSNLFHGKASHQTQARFMGPTYTQFALQLEDEESDSNALPRGSTDNIVLYLPYLNWESCKSWTERQALIQAISENMPGEVQPDLNFVKKYLHHKTAPFHDRRSLHQAYYHDFGMTRPLSRYEQVIQRFTSQTHPEAAKMIVVDQLWLWVIRGVDIAEDGETTSHPDLVITAFPERFNGAYDSANIYSGIIDHLRRGLQPPLRTANHLVAVILEHCTGVFFQRQLEQDKWFLEFFAAAVGTVVGLPHLATSFQQLAH